MDQPIKNCWLQHTQGNRLYNGSRSKTILGSSKNLSENKIF